MRATGAVDFDEAARDGGEGAALNRPHDVALSRARSRRRHMLVGSQVARGSSDRTTDKAASQTATDPLRWDGRLDLMGVGIDNVTESDAVDRVLNALAEGRGGWIVTPNIDVLRQAAGDVSIRRLISTANLSVPDGMPLVWASRLLRRPLPARVAGSTLIWTLCRAADCSGASVFLLGGSPGVAERAAGVLCRAMPQLKVCGHHCPPLGFEYSPNEMRTLVEHLDAAAPNIVFCGLGFPKQEHLISQLRVRFPGTWFLGIGIGLSFVGGEIRRCPIWMQSVGLEWLHRLCREPRRLFTRYILHDIPFALVLLAWACSHRDRPDRRQVTPARHVEDD